MEIETNKSYTDQMNDTMKNTYYSTIEYSKKAFNYATDFIQSTGMNAYNSDKKYMYILFIIVILLIIVFILTYVIIQIKKRKLNCNNISSWYNTFPALSSITSSDYLLRDYYVKSSYNSCASGQFENDWVDTCALTNVIKQGCRFLDFEIYDINDVPVVAVSPTNNRFEKGSYNYITFDDAMQTVAANAFTGGVCPTPKDPLFIHLRIQSLHMDIINKIADILTAHLDDKMLPNLYSYEFNGKNLGAVPLKLLFEKVIVIVEKKNNLFEKSRLDEFVNIASNSVFLRSLYYNNVVYTNDMSELVDFNKKNMSICIPNLSTNATNYNVSAVMQYGVQFPAMCFQTYDNNIQMYNSLFEKEGHSFILKPESLRYIPVTTNPPASPSINYGYNEYKSNIYNFKL